MKDVAHSWAIIQSLEEGTDEYARHEWALRYMGRLIALEPLEAWRVIELIYENNSGNSWVLENLGSGPIETLLRMDGMKVLPLISERLEFDKSFWGVLKHVWSDSLPLEIRKQFDEISQRPHSF